jgi:hypothetical protein
MTNASDFEGLVSLLLVFVCSCVHIRRVPRLRAMLGVAPADAAPPTLHASLLGTTVLRTSKIVLRHRRFVAFMCTAVSFLVLARRY